METLPILSKACKKRKRRAYNKQLRLEKSEIVQENIKMDIKKINKESDPEMFTQKLTSKMRRKLLRQEKFGQEHNKQSNINNPNNQINKKEQDLDNEIDGNMLKESKKNLWCLHDDCLTSIITFKSEEDLKLHIENVH